MTGLALAACGCVTPYQPMAFMGGFSSLQVNPEVYRVSFRGNGYTSEERVVDFTLLRAAELTLSQGTQFFTVAEERRAESHYSEGSHSQGYAYPAPGGVGYQSYTTPEIVVTKHRAELLIRIVRGAPPAGSVIYDAKLIAAQLRRKYHLSE